MLNLTEAQKKELITVSFQLTKEIEDSKIKMDRLTYLITTIPDSNVQFKTDTTAELEALQIKKSELELTLNSYVVQIGSDYDALYAIFASEYKAMFG